MLIKHNVLWSRLVVADSVPSSSLFLYPPAGCVALWSLAGGLFLTYA